MNTLKDHTILYDDACPMCNLYTAGFVKSGMLDRNGRKPFSQCNKDSFSNLDCNRACNEIALINTKTQEVYYGIDSLMLIIQNSFPFFKPLFSNAAFKWIVKKLYSFISYNRKIIVPAPNNISNTCVPSFNVKYRVAYLIFSVLICAWLLHVFTLNLAPFVPVNGFTRELAICSGQIVFQSLVLLFMGRQKIMDYLGNLMTISLAASLILGVVLLITIPFTLPALFYLVIFALVVTGMFVEHLRRTSLLNLPWVISFTWVLYRIIVLFVTGIIRL